MWTKVSGKKSLQNTSISSFISAQRLFATRRNTPLTDEDKAKNRAIAHTRARIEHIFGYMTRFMAGITSRVHGIDRVTRDVTAKNLVYNVRRYVCIEG